MKAVCGEPTLKLSSNALWFKQLKRQVFVLKTGEVVTYKHFFYFQPRWNCMTIAHWLIGFIVSVLVANFPSTARAQQTVDIIITNGHILTMDDQLTEYERGFVAINDNKIVALGPQTKAAAFQAKKN